MSFSSPRLVKGALISYDPVTLNPQVIKFQYNPETLTRQLDASRTSGEGNRAEVQRLKGPPKEKITLKIEIDAADQLEKPEQNPDVVINGIYSQMSALEIMIYPKSSWVITKTNLASAGTIEIAPPEEPFILFVWGPNRVVPVRLTSFSINEQFYDPSLNPIAAEISLTLEVLTYDDFKSTHRGYSIFLSHQILKETMAKNGTTGDVSSVIPGGL